MTNKNNEPNDTDNLEHKDTDKYMEANKETMERPPSEPEGLSEPRTKGYPPLQKGFIVFIVVVLIILVIGISTNMFGLM
ncbi:hypothetical protein [Planomicrobium sp. YIM 101495]|uniref:hypothetical protein n=1 Tax=Planomicrobium sp. YIM 101495 TaxID=2665160 RepID=UPI0012B90A10|nr:hypothetical protein [Planomicrobium sp. YIM 101495]MTD31015.1 hypothetical protein [Planomicrobium sp. YIM 101495]